MGYSPDSCRLAEHKLMRNQTRQRGDQLRLLRDESLAHSFDMERDKLTRFESRDLKRGICSGIGGVCERRRNPKLWLTRLVGLIHRQTNRAPGTVHGVAAATGKS